MELIQYEKYDKIIKCKLIATGYDEVFEDCYLLAGNNIPEECEVELTGDCWFNCDFKKEDVEIVKHIDTIQDVFDFCKEKNIEIAPNRKGKNYLIAGGSIDTIITYNLYYNFIAEELEKKQINMFKVNDVNEVLTLTVKNNVESLRIRG